MTEHSKIPPAGESSIERAGSSFGSGLGSGAFTPAPVPDNLRRPPKRRPNVPRPVVSEPAVTDVAYNATSSPESGVTSLPPKLAPTTASTTAPAHEPQVPALRLEGPVHTIDREMLAKHGLIVPEGQVSGLLEEFRIVKRRVLSSMRKAQDAGAGDLAQRILVCSPLPDEGKSFCAANLAIALAAEKDSEVLLVDADFAKPSILAMFGLPGGDGLMDVLANPDVQLKDCVLRTDIAGLSVLPAGNHTNSDSEFLASSRTDEVLDALTRGAPNRVVIFDSPPALAASPAAELANHVGQAIVIARADRTGQSALADALTLLSTCPDIKLLLNATHFSPSGRRFGAYYGQET